MTSEDKTVPKIDAELVRRLIKSRFPQWCDLPVQAVEIDGWDNRTFRLGETMSVRLPSAEAYSGQVPKEQKWLPILSPLLPLTIPIPLAMGDPDCGYPWHWSIYRWLEGESATLQNIDKSIQFATTLADFLAALQRIDTKDGPEPGHHNFFRGESPGVYDSQTRGAIEALGDRINSQGVAEVWEAALETSWQGRGVWLHGDISPSNLLVRDGKLVAVIDFGCCAVGDPACDLAIAWTFFSGSSREVFRDALPVNSETWARGRGWALWKALITLVESTDARQIMKARQAQQVIDAIVADHIQVG